MIRDLNKNEIVALKLIDELSHSFFHIIQDIKELVFELSSSLLNEIGLSSAISQFLNEQISQKYAFEVEFNEHYHAEPGKGCTAILTAPLQA